MEREGEEKSFTLYSAALKGLRSMTLGGAKTSPEPGAKERRRDSEPALGQAARASEFSPAELVSAEGETSADQSQGENRTLLWQVSTVMDKVD
eukprot:39609-Rhodomonas_salina.1